METINYKTISEPLSYKEMKNVKGGGGDDPNDSPDGGDIPLKCYWESAGDWGCFYGPDAAAYASFMGTVHWCCNNWEANKYC